MKSRNREINIFNMSLLDILCGALGTFCFMMIVLFGYYSATPSNAPEMPKDMVDPKTLQEAMDQIKQLKEALKKMQDYAQGLEGQVNQQKQQISQQQQEIERLQKEIERLKEQSAKDDETVSKLSVRRPFMGWAGFGSNTGDRWQVWWDSPRTRNDQKGKRFTLIPDNYEDQNFFQGDMYGHSRAQSYHIIRDSPPGEYRLVLKIIKHDTSTPMEGYLSVHMWDHLFLGPFMKINIPGPSIIPIATLELGPPGDDQYNVKWTFPAEYNNEPDWKPDEPGKGKQEGSDKNKK